MKNTIAMQRSIFNGGVICSTLTHLDFLGGPCAVSAEFTKKELSDRFVRKVIREALELGLSGSLKIVVERLIR